MMAAPTGVIEMSGVRRSKIETPSSSLGLDGDGKEWADRSRGFRRLARRAFTGHRDDVL